MRRGEMYRVHRGNRPGKPNDPKSFRVFVVVSRQFLVDSRFPTVICAPVHSRWDGFSTQVPVGTEEGLKHPSSILCDELVSLPKSALTDFVGSLSAAKLEALEGCLRIALALD